MVWEAGVWEDPREMEDQGSYWEDPGSGEMGSGEIMGKCRIHGATGRFQGLGSWGQERSQGNGRFGELLGGSRVWGAGVQADPREMKDLGSY